jgi:phospholipid/cholesterol/gamma-HCH transport system substrate-binding protein
MDRKKTDFLVGLFVLAGSAALVFLAFRVANLGGVELGNALDVRARFDNVGGLKPRAPVKSAGVTVGRVKSISFDDGTYQAVVMLSLDRRFQFPKDTSAKILTSGLLGEQYIGLEPGGESSMLVAGSTIGMTQSAVVLENLISQFLYSKAAEPSSVNSGKAPKP